MPDVLHTGDSTTDHHTGSVTPLSTESPVAEGVPTSSEGDSYWFNLDTVDLAPLLAEVEQALSVARSLAEFADDGEVGDWVRDERTNEQVYDELTLQQLRSGPLGSTGADLLSRLASRWERVSAALAFKHLCDAPFCTTGTDVRRHDAIGCLRELDRTAFKECRWAYRTPSWVEEWMVDVYYADTLAPGSRLGMPHSVFARRLAVAAGLLREIVAEEESRIRRMSAKEANEKAMKLAKENSAFINGTAREWADAIGCSASLVVELPLWKEVMRQSGRGKNGCTPPLKAVTFTKELESATGTGEGRELGQLQRLIAEQQADFEPSPLKADHPDSSPTRVRSRKRV